PPARRGAGPAPAALPSARARAPRGRSRRTAGGGDRQPGRLKGFRGRSMRCPRCRRPVPERQPCPACALREGRWADLEALLTDLPFLEAWAQEGLAFELADQLSAATRRLPAGRPVRRLLALLEEALRRDLHFVARRPSTLFQCLWNSCWWHDADEAAAH